MGDPDVPTYRVDMSLPPHERWAEVADRYGKWWPSLVEKMYASMTDDDDAPETPAEREVREAFVLQLCDNICGSEWLQTPAPFNHHTPPPHHHHTIITTGAHFFHSPESLIDSGNADYVDDLKALSELGGVKARHTTRTLAVHLPARTWKLSRRSEGKT